MMPEVGRGLFFCVRKNNFAITQTLLQMSDATLLSIYDITYQFVYVATRI